MLAEARRVDADVLTLQTSLLGVSAGEARPRLAGTGAPELVLAWGAPAGLRYGRDPAALADLTAWIGVAAALECTLVRVVLGSPLTRPVDPPPGFFAESARALAAVAQVAATAGIGLAVENHGDITTTQLLGVLDACGAANVGVCFDSANALRVGEDAVAAARAVAARTLMLHLDVEPFDPAALSVAGPASVPYGAGIVPVAALLDVFAAAGFAGPVLVELGQIGPGTDERALVADCLGWLRAQTGR